jgi:hypothetical protein
MSYLTMVRKLTEANVSEPAKLAKKAKEVPPTRCIDAAVPLLRTTPSAGGGSTAYISAAARTPGGASGKTRRRRLRRRRLTELNGALGGLEGAFSRGLRLAA